MNKFTAVVALSLGLLAGCNSSAPSATSSTTGPANSSDTSTNERSNSLTKIQPIVEKSSRGQYKAVKTFDGPDGMMGVLLEPSSGSGNKLIAWTSPHAEVLLPGPLFDKDGTNLSETLLAQHAGFISTEKLADQIGDRGFVAGTSGPIVTVFFEPYCGYCNKLFKDIKPLVDNGTLRARFVMVGFLQPDSLARAADIAFAKDPYKALSTWEVLGDKTKAKPSTATADQQSKIQSNGNLLNEAGQSATPTILICNKQNKKLEMLRGMPGDFNGFVNSIGTEGHAICSNP